MISQLQELDRQISDLRLDTETVHEHLESDSRPSSGWFQPGISGDLRLSAALKALEIICVDNGIKE